MAAGGRPAPSAHVDAGPLHLPRHRAPSPRATPYRRRRLQPRWRARRRDAAAALRRRCRRGAGRAGRRGCWRKRRLRRRLWRAGGRVGRVGRADLSGARHKARDAPSVGGGDQGAKPSPAPLCGCGLPRGMTTAALYLSFALCGLCVTVLYGADPGCVDRGIQIAGPLAALSLTPIQDLGHTGPHTL